MKYARYYAAVRYLESLGNITGGYQKTNLKSHSRPEMFLERMKDFLNLVGNPEKGFKYVHISGTAGKGSVSSAVHARLVRAGKIAGLFTSPFVTSTIEKIQVGEKYIDPIIFADIVDSLKPSIDKSIISGRHGAPSYFELMLAIALLYFKKMKCEYVVLEVGLGGRYDATNIIEKPLITAITNIGLDHTNILGNSRSDIAKDKSGIIKKGSIFLTTETDPKILSIFKSACHSVGAEYNAVRAKKSDYVSRNMALAGAICTALGIVKKPQDVKKIPILPARFETMEKKPIVIIDGAHNPSKIESTIYNLKKLRFDKLFLIIAISGDKDWKTMMRMASPLADVVYVTRFSVPGRQSVDPAMLMKEAKKYGQENLQIRLYSDPTQAFDDAKLRASKDDAILVTGSFYLAGDIRSLYHPEEKILRHRISF
jgi:dihydrofolate synthase/folylpolyglutamate synthase